MATEHIDGYIMNKTIWFMLMFDPLWFCSKTFSFLSKLLARSDDRKHHPENVLLRAKQDFPPHLIESEIEYDLAKLTCPIVYIDRLVGLGRTEKINWPKKVNNEEVLERIGEKRRLLNNILRKKANWIGHILKRNCFLCDVTEGPMTEVKEVGRRKSQILDCLRNRRAKGGKWR